MEEFVSTALESAIFGSLPNVSSTLNLSAETSNMSTASYFDPATTLTTALSSTNASMSTMETIIASTAVTSLSTLMDNVTHNATAGHMLSENFMVRYQILTFLTGLFYGKWF